MFYSTTANFNCYLNPKRHRLADCLWLLPVPYHLRILWYIIMSREKVEKRLLRRLTERAGLLQPVVGPCNKHDHCCNTSHKYYHENWKLQRELNPSCANGNKSRLLFTSAEMLKKPLWQTVWTQIRLIL